mmetsp:Transcript_4944/g.8227  ORF Transcript_4944/g.8227 Transcript_4944/m.8227 type:complete len:210 (-) Transcript_4944:1036-1665(-)
MLWLVKHVDLSSICFDTTLRVPALEKFLQEEIMDTFDKLGRHMRSVELLRDVRSAATRETFTFYTYSILKRCHNLTTLGFTVPRGHLVGGIDTGTLIGSMKLLPLLTSLRAESITNSEEDSSVNCGVMPLVNILSKRCPALTSLAWSLAPKCDNWFEYDRTLFIRIPFLASLGSSGKRASFHAEILQGPRLPYLAEHLTCNRPFSTTHL